jgi:hypothetical protein
MPYAAACMQFGMDSSKESIAMNSADAKKPKFDGAWWKKNKAKDADPAGKLQTALTKYQEKEKFFFSQTKVSSSGRVEELESALEAVKKEAAAEKGNKKLGVSQKETKEALDNYVKIADAALKELKRLESAPIIKEGVKLLVEKVPQFKEYCTKNYQSESFNFLSLMYKNPAKDKKWYDAFIASGSKFEVNIPGETKRSFDAIAQEIKEGKKPDNTDTWKTAPWEKATKDIEKMLTADVIPRFRFFMTGAMMEGHLP